MLIFIINTSHFFNISFSFSRMGSVNIALGIAVSLVFGEIIHEEIKQQTCSNFVEIEQPHFFIK